MRAEPVWATLFARADSVGTVPPIHTAELARIPTLRDAYLRLAEIERIRTRSATTGSIPAASTKF